jgi:predicted Ser/Thr protein kinase
VAELTPGTGFAGHRIDGVAGRGGMGIVYRARQLALDRTVALKVIAPGLLDDQTMRQRFVRESKVAASIDHPNVIPIYYTGEEKGVAYIAMRYVAGEDLRSLVRLEGRLAPERAAHIVAQTAAALDAAHAAGLVHRDIKPANVLLGPEDHVYLTDFGLTKHALSTVGSTSPGHWVGTLDYVAPEQIRGERVDARADVYALGCLLFFALTGTVPYAREGDEAKLWAHLSAPAPRPSEAASGVPEAFDAAVERALAKDPDDRYPSAGDLGRAALAAAAGRRPPQHERLVARGEAAPPEAETVSGERPLSVTRRQSETKTLVQPVRRRRHVVALAAALLAAAGAGVVIALTIDGGAEQSAGAPTPAPATPTASRSPSPEPEEEPALTISDEIAAGDRPNVVHVAGEKVFVGSFRERRMTVVSATSGRRLAQRPAIGRGVIDIAEGPGALWLGMAADRRLVRLNPRTGRRMASIPLPGSPTSVTVAGGAVWTGLVAGSKNEPDRLLKLDPGTGAVLANVPYPFGIVALTGDARTLWVLNRRRARLQRADLTSGQIVHTMSLGSHPGRDMAYARGAVWIASPEDDAVFKVVAATNELITIGVGRSPRQLAVGRDRVFVTNYASSDLNQIDQDTSRIVGEPLSLPVNPYALAVGSGGLWVTSLAEDKLVHVVTDRGA